MEAVVCSSEVDPVAGITVMVDGKSVTLDLGRGHRSTETKFNRFGFVTTWIDGNGQHIYYDDLTYTVEQ